MSVLAGGAELLVARIPHLIAMKVLSECEARMQDRSDLQALFKVASKIEQQRARELVKLIEGRGFHRDRDLSERFAELQREFRGD